MNNRNFINGLTILAAGLFASSISSFLERFPLLGNATDLTRGFIDGLSVIAFGVAIYFLVKSKEGKNDNT